MGYLGLLWDGLELGSRQDVLGLDVGDWSSSRTFCTSWLVDLGLEHKLGRELEDPLNDLADFGLEQVYFLLILISWAGAGQPRPPGLENGNC